MTSIAVWPTLNQKPGKSNTVSLKLHVNLWTIPRIPDSAKEEFNGFHRLVDFGIKINCNNIDRLNIYFPVSLTKSQIIDLYHEIIKSSEASTEPVISAIYNRMFNITSVAKSDISDIQEVNGRDKFIALQLDGSHCHYDTEEIKNGKRIGTILKIYPLGLTDFYIRFRIDQQEMVQLLWSQETSSNTIFQSAFSQNEITELRVNEKRNLPSTVLRIMQKDMPPSPDNFITIESLDFIYVCSQSEDITHYHSSPRKSRRLEPGIWESYSGLKLSKLTTPLLAYHWREPEKKALEEWNSNILIKTRHDVRNWKIITKYLIFALIFSLFGNMTYDGLKILINKFFTHRSNQISPVTNIPQEKIKGR